MSRRRLLSLRGLDRLVQQADFLSLRVSVALHEALLCQISGSFHSSEAFLGFRV